MFQGTRFHLQPLNTRKGMYAIGVLLGSPHFGEVSFPARQLGGTDCKPQKGDHYRDRKKKRICLQCWGHRAGDLRVSPGLGRCPGEGNGNPLQYSCLGNPMDRGAWQATVHGVQRVGHDLAIKQQQLQAGPWTFHLWFGAQFHYR